MNRIFESLEGIWNFVNIDSAWLKLFYKAGATLLVCGITWLVMKKIIGSMEKKVPGFSWFKIHSEIFRVIQKAVGYLLLLVCGTYFIQLFHFRLLEKPFQAFFIILFAGPLYRFLLIIIQYLKDNIATKTETNVDDIIFDLLNKFSGVIVYTVAIIAALDIVGINVMPFIAGAGVLGIAIGFAAKDTLSNLIAGILLIVDRPFEVGDRIEVWTAPTGSASWGDVVDIGIRATKIKTTDNIVIVIPNNEIMMRDIVNYTLNNAAIRVRVDIGVAYDTNVDKAKSVIIEVAEKMEWILKAPPPKVVVKKFGESSVELQLRIWIGDARRRMDTISYVTDHVKSAFEAAGIRIPFPRRDITIVHKGREEEKQAVFTADFDI